MRLKLLPADGYACPLDIRLMSRFTMSLKCLFAAALVAVTLLVAQSSADIVVTSTEPTAVLLDSIGGSRIQTIINSTVANGSRGSGFSLASSTPGVSQFDISSLTLDAGTNDIAAGFQFTVSIYDGSPYNLSFTEAGGTSVTNAQFQSQTGLPLLGEEVFTVQGGLSTTDLDFVTFNFANDIRVDANSDLAVLVQTTDAFNQLEGIRNATDARFLFRSTTTDTPNPNSNSNFGLRDLRFSIGGTAVAVPEPSSLAILVAGSVSLVMRRRR